MEWIKCNLPWSYHDYTSAPPYDGPVDRDDDIRKLFGRTEDEMQSDTYGDDMLDSPVWKAFRLIGDQVQYEVNELNLSQEEREAERYRRLEAMSDSNVVAVMACRKHIRAVQDWYNAQPDVIEANAKYQAAHKAWTEDNDSKSFTGRGLAKSGVLMRVQVGDQIETHLIGTINELGGACDDCMGFPNDSIVLEYKVIYSGE